ncbi:MAG: CRISPR-associated endonuclease Cas1 [bacterium]
MQLVINTYGAYLQRNGDCFRVKAGDNSFEISAAKVATILIATAATITTDAVQLAIDHNIDLVFVDDFGSPYARVWQLLC